MQKRGIIIVEALVALILTIFIVSFIFSKVAGLIKLGNNVDQKEIKRFDERIKEVYNNPSMNSQGIAPRILQKSVLFFINETSNEIKIYSKEGDFLIERSGTFGYCNPGSSCLCYCERAEFEEKIFLCNKNSITCKNYNIQFFKPDKFFHSVEADIKFEGGWAISNLFDKVFSSRVDMIIESVNSGLMICQSSGTSDYCSGLTVK